MIVLNINGFELIGRIPKRTFQGDTSRLATAIKREALISAFQQMPDSIVDEIWARALKEEPRLELLPRNDVELLSKIEKE